MFSGAGYYTCGGRCMFTMSRGIESWNVRWEGHVAGSCYELFFRNFESTGLISQGGLRLSIDIRVLTATAQKI